MRGGGSGVINNTASGVIETALFHNSAKINNYGKFEIDDLVNDHSFFNHDNSVGKFKKINNHGTINSSGSMYVSDKLLNYADLHLSGSTKINQISNIDENSNIFNDGILLVLNIITNAGRIENTDNGIIKVSELNNSGDIYNRGKYYISGLLINEKQFNNESNSVLEVSSINNLSNGLISNSGSVVIQSNLVNSGIFENNINGNITAFSALNNFSKVLNNNGNISVTGLFNNNGLINNINTIDILDFNNDSYGVIKNSGNFSVTNILNNKNKFENSVSGIVTVKSLINEKSIKNSGKITVTEKFINNNLFENSDNSIFSVSILNNNINSEFVNQGNTTIVDLINYGRFKHNSNVNLTSSNIKNMSDFINNGVVSVSNDFINSGNLIITTDSRLTINGAYKQNNGSIQLTLNGNTDDALITASSISFQNAVLKLSRDDNFDLNVTKYVLIKSDSQLSLNLLAEFRNNIDAYGLGSVGYNIELTPDRKKLLLNIYAITVPDENDSLLTIDERNLINTLASFDVSRLRHPYLKKIILAFKNNSIPIINKKMLAQSLTYTPANASVRVVRDNYNMVINKITSNLYSKITNKLNNNYVSMNYLSSSNNYYLIKDVYDFKNDLHNSLNYNIDMRGTDLFNGSIVVDDFANQDINKQSDIKNNTDIKTDNYGFRIWADVLYSMNKYNRNNYYETFKTNTSGFIVGLDKSFSEKILAGLSVATSNSDTKEPSFSISTTNVNASIYSMTRMKNSYFTNILSYGFFNHDQGRMKVNEFLQSKYNTYGVGFYTEYKYLLTDHFNMKSFVRFGLNKQSAIREETKSGIGGLERNIDSIAYNDFVAGYGVSFDNKMYQSGKISLMPFASVDYEYNFSHSPLNVSSYFVDMGVDYKFITKTDKNSLHKLYLSTGVSFARNDIKNPFITKIMYSLGVAAGYSNTLSLKFIKSF